MVQTGTSSGACPSGAGEVGRVSVVRNGGWNKQTFPAGQGEALPRSDLGYG